MSTAAISIDIGRGYKTVIDLDDIDKLGPYKWKRLINQTGTVYAARTSRVNGRSINIYLHKIIAGSSGVVDHINGNTLDNRKENLRSCSLLQNSKNRRIGSNSTCGAKGVRRSKTKSIRFDARILCNGTRITVGSFDTVDEAAHAYNKAAVMLHGDFACLNPVGIDPRGESS